MPDKQMLCAFAAQCSAGITLSDKENVLSGLHGNEELSTCVSTPAECDLAVWHPQCTCQGCARDIMSAGALCPICRSNIQSTITARF